VAVEAAGARTVDRLYRFGDDPRENPVVGSLMTAKTPQAPFTNAMTIDSAGTVGAGQQVVNLLAGSTGVPTYVAVTGRPDGVGGVALNFNGANTAAGRNRVTGQRLGTPETSISSTVSGGSLNYFFALDRGFQFWARPSVVPNTGSGLDSDTDQMVMDTNNHGALIDSFGRYTMRYNGIDYPGVGTQAQAVVNDWAHIMVVRPERTNPFSVMYVDGVATAAVRGDYSRTIPPLGTVNDIADTAPLVVGGRTVVASQTGVGTTRNYSGIIDDLEMFVVGLGPGGDFGEFDFATDNLYAARFKPTNPLDLAGGDGLVTLSDVSVFVDNWLYQKSVNGVQVGDLETVARGDFDYSGVVDIADWRFLNDANPQLGAVAMAMIQSTPEPSSTLLVAPLVAALGLVRRR
jgi:hypothetical protein